MRASLLCVESGSSCNPKASDERLIFQKTDFATFDRITDFPEDDLMRAAFQDGA
jgi:hypothetical protein